MLYGIGLPTGNCPSIDERRRTVDCPRVALAEGPLATGTARPWASWRRPMAAICAGSRTGRRTDATNRLRASRFAATELTFSYLETMRAFIGRAGKPGGVSQRQGLMQFRSPATGRTERSVKHFGRAIYALNTDILLDSSLAQVCRECAHLTLSYSAVAYPLSESAAQKIPCGD